MRASGLGVLVGALLFGCSGTRTNLPEDGAEAAGPRTSPDPVTPDATTPEPRSGVICRATPRASKPVWYDGAVFYEIFVRSFQDSDGDGVGDLKGIVDRLDYLNDGDPATDTDLGIDALWLMPIHPSPSYHGYDVTDYRAINKEYGSLEDFDLLLAECSKRGIRVVIDLVANHTSSQHPWFVKGKRGSDQPFSDRYVWSDEKLAWGQPWKAGGTTWHQAASRYYYGVFWSGMPDLNFESPAVRDEMKSIASFWAKRGVSGFRLDAARYLIETGEGDGQADQPATHAYWKELRAHLDKSYPNTLLVGEVWTDLKTTVTYFGAGDELQMLFGFDRADGIRQALRLGTVGPVGGPLCGELDHASGVGTLGSFLTNHDLDRLASDVPDAAGLRLAATLLLTLPGTPFLYYGEELGMANGKGNGDIAKRLPMRWDETLSAGFTTGTPWQPPGPPGPPSVSVAGGDPASLLSHYRRLIRLRRGHAALSSGLTVRLRVQSSGGSVLAVFRHDGESRTVLVANLAKETASTVSVELPGSELQLPPTWSASPLLTSGGTVEAVRKGESLVIDTLPARGVRLIQIDSPRSSNPG